MAAPKEVKEELNRILIKREADKRKEQAEKEVKEFETLWNELVSVYRARKTVPVTVTGIERLQKEVGRKIPQFLIL